MLDFLQLIKTKGECPETRGGVSHAPARSHPSRWTDPTCQVETARAVKAPAATWNPGPPCSLRSGTLPSGRVSTGWRCRKPPGMSRRDTRRCWLSAPELTAQCGEFTPGRVRKHLKKNSHSFNIFKMIIDIITSFFFKFSLSYSHQFRFELFLFTF